MAMERGSATMATVSPAMASARSWGRPFAQDRQEFRRIEFRETWRVALLWSRCFHVWAAPLQRKRRERRLFVGGRRRGLEFLVRVSGRRI